MKFSFSQVQAPVLLSMRVPALNQRTTGMLRVEDEQLVPLLKSGVYELQLSAS